MMTNGRDARAPARRWRRPAAVLGFSAAVVAVAWAAADAALKPAPLETLVPEYVPGFAVADARQAWDITADLRNTPAARKGLARLEKELHVSIATDVLPWAGQVGAAALNMNPKSLHAAFYVEVRNPVEYYLTMARLRTRLERRATPWWKAATHDGVTLRYGYVRAANGDRIPVSTAWLNGWLVVGVGEGATRDVIDAAHGRKRSLATNTAWSTTLARVPEGSILRYGMNTGLLSQALRVPGIPKELVERAHAVTAVAASVTDDGVRMQSASTPTSAAARTMMQSLARNLTPAPVDLLDRLPADTFASVATGNPGGWWTVYEPMFSRMYGSGDANDALKPVGDLVRRFTGGVAVGAAYDAARGWGVVATGRCATPESARAAADALSDFVEAGGGKVEIGADEQSFSVSAMDPATPFAPAWSVDGALMTAASNKGWLEAPAGVEGISLPPGAEGAQVMARGNFRFVDALMGQAAALPGAAKGMSRASAEARWKASRLGGARWSAWARFAPDGASDGAVEIADWPWREALRATAK